MDKENCPICECPLGWHTIDNQMQMRCPPDVLHILELKAENLCLRELLKAKNTK